MFNFKARDFFLAGFILGAIAVALIMLSILLFQARSAVAEEPEPVPEEPTRVVEEPTMAPEEPTVDPTATRAVDPDSLRGLHYILLNPTKAPLDDIRVRQALRSAIDRSYLAEVAITEPALFEDDILLKESLERLNAYPTGIMAPGFMQLDELQNELMLPYEPENIQALLGEAGLKLVAAVPPDQTAWLFTIYKQAWEPIGIDLVRVVEVPEQGVAEAMRKQGVDVYLSPARRLEGDLIGYYRAILNPLNQMGRTDMGRTDSDLVRFSRQFEGLIGEITADWDNRVEFISDLEQFVIEDWVLVIPVFRFGPAEPQ